MNTPALLIAASAAVILFLGVMHLIFTFYGPKFDPRDAELKARMMTVSPVITRQTTMWRAWIGFNASHSYGAILFGAVWGYLALAYPAFLFESVFLLALGLVALLGYLVLGKIYWFSTPFRGILLATMLYVSGLLVHFI
ncbi:MAG TPA: hypothetical protein VE934_00685 [Polaromonas sp.]|uniref:LIC_13387 family protein n=1 Tax=Polaromonas sp. TaxID=1869339 RepID=UPI002D29972C|nr:hypothetical protein [Polaromonas sp.]HYW55448.1 hypothetical protein [Polaromonas sp.]